LRHPDVHQDDVGTVLPDGCHRVTQSSVLPTTWMSSAADGTARLSDFEPALEHETTGSWMASSK
jgi:hypothetical protein